VSIEELKERWREALSHRGRCPRCGSGRVWHNGVRLRKACLQCGDHTEHVADIPVRRLRCGDCSKRWSHAPEQIVTRGRNQPCVVAAAVTQAELDETARDTVVAREHGVDRRTLGRWVDRIAAVADPAALGARLVAESGAPVLPAPPLTVRPRRSPLRAARGLRAVWVLFLLEALASLRGLAPPGLSHAERLVPAHAPPTGARGRAPSEA
jgi:hypothetical protein